MNLIKLLAILGLWLTPLPVFADATAPSPISAETRVNQRQVTIGDVVTYSIVVRHDTGIHILPPDPTAHFEKGFEYVDQGASEPKEIKEQQEETFWFKFRADAVGFYNLPQIPIEFTAPSPGDASHPIPGTLQAPEAVIEVRSVLFQDGTPNDIKDIKPIIGAGFDWQRYLRWILSGLVALAVVAGFIWWFKQTKKTSAPVATLVPGLKPHEIALAELDRLLARKLLDSGQFQEHYFELSEIFRRYLGTLLSIPALDWTTEEIGEYVSSHSATNPDMRQTILALLPATDQVKFAKAPVELQTALNHVEAVRSFIRTTTPEITSKFQVKPQEAA
ncbi:MAG: hypothetical protein V3R14_06835 [Nitrospinaceae bacterium]